MKVAVVAEYYPRRADPVLGVWAHRQALAARDAGAEVEVFVLHRPVPPKAALRDRDLGALVAPLRQPLRSELDGLRVTYVPFLAPPRPRSYASWGAYGAKPLRIALRRERFDLVHAHYAAPAGDAVRRAVPAAPMVVSVHGGDVLSVAKDSERGREVVSAALRHARVVLANSGGTAERCRELGGQDVRVVHLGADVPEAVPEHRPDVIVTVAHLVGRKRHADVLQALADLPALRYEVVGDGPERPRLEALAEELGVADRVTFLGALAPEQARAKAGSAAVFVLPSVDEAFGVAYIEAMAAGVPAVGLAGEAGPEAIARCGGGIVLARPGGLTDAIRLAHAERETLGAAARANVLEHFTWERCGRDTVAAYHHALERPRDPLPGVSRGRSARGDRERPA